MHLQLFDFLFLLLLLLLKCSGSAKLAWEPFRGAVSRATEGTYFKGRLGLMAYGLTFGSFRADLEDHGTYYLPLVSRE